MKRVNAITKGKASCITELVDRKAKRIMRGVDQAIDFASDKIDELNDAAEELINSLGDVAGNTDTSALATRINRYADTLSAIEDWTNTVKRLKTLKEKLNADVKLEDDEK